MKFLILFYIFQSTLSLANPYPDPKKVPFDKLSSPLSLHLAKVSPLSTLDIPVLRLQVDWSMQEGLELFKLTKIQKENSGTPGMQTARLKKPKWGSYLGILNCDGVLYYDSVGTGSSYRKLTRAMTFRYPLPESTCLFTLKAEDPISGEMNDVLSTPVDPVTAEASPQLNVDVTPLQSATTLEKVYVNIYSEGYKLEEREIFLNNAKQTITSLNKLPFPGIESFEFNAVFAPSNKALGSAMDLGLPVTKRDSFLGLYFPYWAKDIVVRWYNVIYPTRQL